LQEHPSYHEDFCLHFFKSPQVDEEFYVGEYELGLWVGVWNNQIWHLIINERKPTCRNQCIRKITTNVATTSRSSSSSTSILQQNSSQTIKIFNKSTMPLQTHHHAPPPI
jgi:hypothetical protein